MSETDSVCDFIAHFFFLLRDKGRLQPRSIES